MKSSKYVIFVKYALATIPPNFNELSEVVPPPELPFLTYSLAAYPPNFAESAAVPVNDRKLVDTQVLALSTSVFVAYEV
jgi:hypothetical protein